MLRALLCACFLVGCGGDDDGAGPDAADVDDADAGEADPDGAPSPGLLVTGTVRVENPSNLAVDANHRVNLEVRVTRGGEPVTDAVIRINPAPPAFQTFLAGVATDPSLYTGSYMGFHETARMTVTSGDDEVAETTLIGISLFQITAPPPGIAVPPGLDFTVTWSRAEVADTLEVTTAGGYDSTPLADGAEHTVPGQVISVDTPDDRVTVSRWRHNELTAAPGSFIDFGVATSIPFTVTGP